MVAPLKPKKVRAHGNDSWWLVPAIADLTAPTIAEINAATGLNFSCAVLQDGDSLVRTTNKVTLPAYLCETENFEGLDNSTWSMGDIVGGVDPQAAAASDDKEHFEFLRDGFSGFAVRRQGKKADTDTPDAVAGEFFDIVPVDVSEAVTDRSSAGNDAIYTFRSGVAVTGKPAINVAAVAA